MSGPSDVARDARFNELPIERRLELLDDLNVQYVLISGIRTEKSNMGGGNGQMEVKP